MLDWLGSQRDEHGCDPRRAPIGPGTPPPGPPTCSTPRARQSRVYCRHGAWDRGMLARIESRSRGATGGARRRYLGRDASTTTVESAFPARRKRGLRRMRSLRITTGLVASLLTLALAAAPAYANIEAPKAFFGEFTASIVGKKISPTEKQKFKGHGEIDTMVLGPWEFRCLRNQGQRVRRSGTVGNVQDRIEHRRLRSEDEAEIGRRGMEKGQVLKGL